jgi:hypothetical protein
VPAKRSLLIGIDEYPHVRRLKGCVNDVRLMQRVLVDTFGFADEHATVLNEQARAPASSRRSTVSSTPRAPPISSSSTTRDTGRR